MNSFYKSKHFRYGSAATAFTCAFIAVVVVFNVIFTALAGKYMWYVDMTEEEVFSLSEATRDLMSDVDAEVNIYFASEPDELMEGTYSSLMKYVYTTALQLEAEYPNIHVECKDVVKNRAFFEPFRSTAATNILTTSVVMESGGESRVFGYEYFFIVDEDGETVWAYNGEKKFMSGIMQVTSAEKPIVYFTAEHGEDLDGAVPLANLFAENGYEVRSINLAKDEIDEDARIIVVNDPMYDFIGAEADEDSANEINKLDAFLDNFGCLMVFADPDHAGNLSNLSEFLEEWGIAFTPDTYVRDLDHSMTSDGLSVLAQYAEDGTLGATLYSDLVKNLSTPPKTVSRYTMPIEILWEDGGSLSGARTVAPVLTSYDSASAIQKGTQLGKGNYNLMTLSRETRVIDNEYYFSYVLVSGSADFAASNYIYSNAFANADILSSTMSITGRERTLANIKYKVFDDTDLEITTAQANNWTLALVLVLPAAAAVTGFVIWVRRKHS